MLSPEMKKQLREILGFVIALGLVQLCVFFILGRTAIEVPFLKALAGTAAGCAVAMLNMLLLAIGIERAVDKGEKAAQAAMSGGYMLRLAVIAVYVFAVIKLPGVFSVWAAIIPLTFTRIAIMMITLKNASRKGGGDK